MFVYFLLVFLFFFSEEYLHVRHNRSFLRGYGLTGI